ncbi:preprotein translocase subunit SecG [Ureaplasma ceti]
MLAIVIVCSIMAVLCLIIGLLLSKSGSSGGLATLAGQDLEIFKKTKDRGWIKWFQVLMFIMTVVLIIIAIVVHFTVK